jgi:uncharacterized RmlC-like cupin family protein
MGAITRIGLEDLVEAPGTKGIQRWVAVADQGFWAGIATTEPNLASGWHHHSDHHTLVYLLEGRMSIEWGEGPGESASAETNEFLHVPPNTIHREINPDPTPARAIIIRIGEGEPVVNVSGPGKRSQ